MGTQWETLVIDDKVRSKVIRLIEAADPVFSFTEHRHLAAMVACLGLGAEIGGELDRLGPALGATSGWRSEIIAYRDEIGIRLWSESGMELAPTEKALAPFVNALSLHDGKLSQIVLFPAQIADEFKTRGLELVIVRDWILRSGLVSDRAQAINYTRSNVWEIGQNIALTQAGLMRQCRLAFFGTHDVADHLMGATRDGIMQSGRVIESILTRYRQFETWSNERLMLSYLIAMVLDDLAQPRWYGSQDHELLTQKLLDRLEASRNPGKPIFIPQTFTPIIDLMRAKDEAFAVKVDRLLDVLDKEIAA